MLLANPWALPLFFLIAGAASKFALRRRSNRQYIWLVYGNGTVMPFYLVHQPVIIVLAFFVVQWAGVGLLVKLLAVMLGSLALSLGLIELLIRPFKPFRTLVGMKAKA